MNMDKILNLLFIILCAVPTLAMAIYFALLPKKKPPSDISNVNRPWAYWDHTKKK